MLRRLLVAGILSIAVNSAAFGYTDVPGGSVSGEHWTTVGSPYLVHGDIYVSGLTIDPGVEVRVDANCGIYVQVALFAQGTASCPIIFTAADPANRWTGFTFDGVAPGSILEQCHVEYANNSGIRIIDCTPVIEHCAISNNTSNSYGGGIWVSIGLNDLTPVIKNCDIVNNTSYGAGGGIFASVGTVTLELRGCNIVDNYATTNTDGNSYGGGVFMSSGNLLISNCKILHNTCYAESYVTSTGRGGGLYLGYGTHQIMHCLIAENTASAYTSGSYWPASAYGGGFASWGDVEMHNTVVVGNAVDATNHYGGQYAHNYGGGSYSVADLIMFNSVVAFNVCEGIYNDGGAAFVRNSILWGNAIQAAGSVDITYSCVEGGWTGTGNISYNPAFVGQGYATGDYLLSPYSPCIDAGDPDPAYYDNCIPPAQGEERNDMGAYGGPNLCPGYSAVWPQSPTMTDRQILLPNYPNPFGASTTIHYDLPERAEVSLRVYDSAGRLVRTLIAGESSTAGRNSSVWDGTDEYGGTVSSGVYFYRLETPSLSESRRMTLIGYK